MAASLPGLPTGFRFRPSDQDIVINYLRPRAVNEPLPAALIVDVDITSHNPWDIVPEGTEEKYFFSQKVRKWPHSNRRQRAAGNGRWRATGTETPIFYRNIHGGPVFKVGVRRTLVFHLGKAPGQRTQWMMNEYSLDQYGLLPCRVMRPSSKSNNIGNSSSSAAGAAKKDVGASETVRSNVANPPMVPVMVTPDASWIVCRIYKSNKPAPTVIAKSYSVSGGGRVLFYDFLGQGNLKGASIPSSSTNLV